MLTLSKVLCSHSRTINAVSFSALLKAEKDRDRDLFNFLLYDPEDPKVAVPCVFHPQCFKTFPAPKLFESDTIPISVEIWCLVFQRTFKFIEITSFAVTGTDNTEESSMRIGTEMSKEGIVIGKSVPLDKMSFSIHFANPRGEFVVSNTFRSPYSLVYDLMGPGMNISFSGPLTSHGNRFCTTEKTSIFIYPNRKWSLRKFDCFSGTITGFGFCSFILDERIPVFLTHFPLKNLSISSSLRKGAVVTVWNFHRLFNESSGDVGALSLCGYSTITIKEFSSSVYGNSKWLDATISAQESLSEYNIVDGITISNIIYQLEEKWHFLPYSVLRNYSKILLERLGLGFDKKKVLPRDQFEAHLIGNRCPSLGNNPPILKKIPSLPTIKEILERDLKPKSGLMYSMKKDQDEKLIGIVHETHRKHGILVFRLEDGTGSIKVCTKDRKDITDESLAFFEDYTLIEEEKQWYFMTGKGTKQHHIRYVQVNDLRGHTKESQEVQIFILRKADLYGNAVVINKNPRFKGRTVLITFENQSTADRYMAPSGYKLWVDEEWNSSKVIKESYRCLAVGRVDLWEVSNPIIRNELEKRIIKSGIILYKTTVTIPTPAVHLMCKEVSGTGTFTVELGWEWEQMLGLLPGAIVLFRDITYIPMRRTVFDTNGTFIYDTSKSDYEIVSFSTQKYYDSIRGPRSLPKFSNTGSFGRPRMTLFEFNKLKPTSECVICCNIAAVKYFRIFSSVPYFRGALAAVFDDGTDVWHGRIENEVLQKLLGLVDTDLNNWEWSCRLNIIVKGDKITNVDATDPVREAKFLLEDL